MTTKQVTAHFTVADGDDCLLNYLPSTYPVPIQTATGQTPARARINTAALPAPGRNVYCNQIVIVVPVGSEAGDIFQQTPTAAINTGKWAITSRRRMKGRDLGLNNDLEYAVFTFDCRDPSDYLINYNLVFSIEGAVTNVASPCTVQIMETSGTSSDASRFTIKNCSYTISTSTPQFYLTNFVATVAGSPTVPSTQFANGADIRLSWESNGAFFQIYQKDNPRPVWAGMQTSYTLRGGVKTDTTFFLVAMVSGDPGRDQPQAGYQPIYLYDALTITISNPDLTPNSSDIAGTLHVKGNTTVSGILSVSGASTLGGNSVVGGTLGVGSNFIARSINGATVAVVENRNAGVLSINPDGGNVGVGTTDPGTHLHVRGGGDQEIMIESTDAGGVKWTLQSSAGGAGGRFEIVNRTAQRNRFTILKDGNVGIGTTEPTHAMLEVYGSGRSYVMDPFGYLNNLYPPNGPTGISNSREVKYSIWASGNTAALAFIAYSDERIKEIEGRSDSAADLRTLLSLEVTDYRYTDAVAQGDGRHKKLIAQQVERVFPQAVGRNTDVVPDIYRQAAFADGWVELGTDLKVGERVRLIAEKAEGVYEVLEVKPERFRTDFHPESNKVFVYGREVSDFRTLDYEAISMLNVSATQQLKREKDKEVEALRAECAGLRAANDALRDRLERLESKMEAALSLTAASLSDAALKL